MSNSDLIFETLTLKNFISFGNYITSIDLNTGDLTAIMGVNLDAGGEDSKNGTGKSTIMDALTYVLYGKVVREVNNPQLIHRWVRKGQAMLVTLTFTKNGNRYLVERGLKPNKFDVWCKPIDNDDDFKKLDDDGKFCYNVTTRGKEGRDILIDTIGVDFMVFQYIIMNSSESEPFLKLREDKKKEIFERLFNLSALSERAKELKEERKEVNRSLTAKESEVNATNAANERVMQQIDQAERRRDEWEDTRSKMIKDLEKSIDRLKAIDVDEEIKIMKEMQEALDQLDDVERELRQVKKDKASNEREARSLTRQYNNMVDQAEKLVADIEHIEGGKCPTCSQKWIPDESEITTRVEKLESLSGEIDSLEESIKDIENSAETIDAKASDLKQRHDDVSKEVEKYDDRELAFGSLDEAYKSQTKLESLIENLEKEKKQENPHLDTIENMKSQAIVEVDHNIVKNMRKVVNHYDTLIDLSQNKNSYIRRSIINMWLPKLNGRIQFYLDQLVLPYRVRIKPDLTVEIYDNRELSAYGSLSRGERQRLTVAVNLAFRDLFEGMNFRSNVLMIDELLDNGICSRGADDALAILRESTEAKNKSVFLVTHRDDIASKIDKVIRVVKNNKQSVVKDGD